MSGGANCGSSGGGSGGNGCGSSGGGSGGHSHHSGSGGHSGGHHHHHTSIYCCFFSGGRNSGCHSNNTQAPERQSMEAEAKTVAARADNDPIRAADYTDPSTGYASLGTRPGGM